MSFSIRRFVPAALLALALGGTSPITVVLAQQPVAAGVDAAASLQTDEVRLGAFFESVFQRNLAASPLFQSQIGIKGPDYGKWDDLSDAEQMRQHELDRKDLAVLHANFDYAVLSPQAQVSYRIFEFQQEQRLSGFEWRFHDYVFSTTSNPVTEAASFMQNIHEVSDVSDAEAYIARLEAIANAMDQSIVKLRQAAVRGIVPTSFSFDPVLEDIGSLLQGAPFDDSGKDCALLADFRAKVVALELDDGERERLLAAAMEALKGPFRAALDRFMVAVEELRPRSHGPQGVWALPQGDAYYRNRVGLWTTDATLQPEQIHHLGIAEVARIRAGMELLMRQTGFDGDLAEFFTHLRNDPDNFFPNTAAGRQAYLEQSKGYIDAIRADSDKDFNVRPKAPLEVRRVEQWREATAPIAFYEQPAPDGSRPGIYYVNLRDMNNQQKHEMQTVAYHEGAPGHHFQIAIQQELADVPMFQKFAFFGAYVEGWALYAERLAKEEGRFTDPLQDFGRLQNVMLGAVWLVLDTGVHTRKWSREQAIDYMLANMPMTPESVAKEIERYFDNPGQALSYKIGMMRILELREKTRSVLGERLDIRAFHDVVLTNGSVPLPILATLVDDHIAARRAVP